MMTYISRRFRSRIVTTLAGGAIAALGATAALALSVALVPGGSVLMPATTAATQPVLDGVVVQDPLIPFKIVTPSGAVVCEGNLQDRTVRSTKTGLLDFYYAIRDTKGSGLINRMVTTGYAGQSIQVAYRTDGLGTVAPKAAARSGAPGDQVAFDFEPPLSCAQGQVSRFILIMTQVKASVAGGNTTIVSTVGDSVTLHTAKP